MKSCFNCSKKTSVFLASPCFNCVNQSKFEPMEIQTTGYEMESKPCKAKK